MNKFAEQFEQDVLTRYQQKLAFLAGLDKQTPFFKQAESLPGINYDDYDDEGFNALLDALEESDNDYASKQKANVEKSLGIPNKDFANLDEFDKTHDSFMDSLGTLGADYIYPRVKPVASAVSSFVPSNSSTDKAPDAPVSKINYNRPPFGTSRSYQYDFDESGHHVIGSTLHDNDLSAVSFLGDPDSYTNSRYY